MKKKYFFTRISINKSVLFYFFILTAFISHGQDLIFTANTAVISGSTVTETLVDGSDTYILTANTSNPAALDELVLGGGDYVFYVSGIDNSLTPWTISITKNGTATNFTLTGIDYDTFQEDNVSIINQDNNIITASTTYAVGAGSIIIGNVVNATNISNFKIVPSDNDDLNNFGFHNIGVTIVDPALSIDDAVFSNSINIYPNPSNGRIFIKNNSDLGLKSLQVSDINGRILKTIPFEDSLFEREIDLYDLTTGLYFITITSDKSIAIKKLLIN